MVVSVVAASQVASQVLPLPLLPMMIIFILTKLLKLIPPLTCDTKVYRLLSGGK